MAYLAHLDTYSLKKQDFGLLLRNLFSRELSEVLSSPEFPDIDCSKHKNCRGKWERGEDFMLAENNFVVLSTVEDNSSRMI